MAVIEQNPNVTLGDWRSDSNYATANRICTYADLVDKTLAVSGDVLHELGGSDNIKNIYVINGRKTLTYQQLSHCEEIKVYLKTSSTAREQHMYRFNGEVKQLCRFSCKETDSLNGNVPYKYNQCVTVSDIECIENTKEIRFRFKNITFRPCIKFIVGGSGVEWCSLVEVERENDLTNPHDIYIKMKNGLKAKFAIELYNSQSSSEYIYIGSDDYYGGSIKEYDSSYGGAVNLTYTSYDNIIPPVDWLANQTQEFIVEPYLENAQVTLTGTRNTPIYIEIETDSRFTVRNMTHAKFAEACNDTYENQAEYGVLSVIPGDYAGYFMTPIADPGHAYVTLMSQDVNQWDRFEGTVEEYDTNGDPTHEQPWKIKLQSFSPEVPSAWAWGPMNWGIEIHKKCNGEKFVHKYSYKLKLISKAAFYPTIVNVVEWRDLSIKYLPSETEIIDVSSQPSGQKWIHTFYTKETETPQNITLKAIVKSDSIEAGEMGYNATYAIVKVSLSTNQNNKLVSFALDGSVGPGAYAVVPYVHSSSIMPRSLELYMRVLPNVTVNFMFPNGYQVQKEGGSYESGEPINEYYNTVQLQFDAETVQSELITISIKRNQVGTHGYNYLTPSFYYNSSWTGGVALEVTFSGLAGKTFDVGQSTAVIANHVSFALGTTEFSIRFAGSQRSALALTFIIPSFRSGCLNNYAEVAPAADSTENGGKGGYLGPMLVDQEQIEGSCAIYQGNSNELIVSADGRPDSWIGAMGYSYSFDISDTLIKIVPKTLSGVATIQNGYLPSTIYKEVTATGNDLTVESTPRTLTSSIYEPLTYSSTSPMFKFTINSGASAPTATLTAVKWSDTDIYIFSMNKDIEGESGHFDIRGITSGFEGTEGTKFNFSTTAASVPTSYSGSETNHLKYTFVLPDWFYGIKNGHKRTFRMDMNRSIWAGKQNTATGGTHLKGIEKYRIVAYREYNPNGSSGSQIFDKTLDCTGDYTEFRLDNLTTDENIFNIASNLGRPMALVIIPIEGEPLMNISGILWWNGTSMQSSTYNQDPVYLSPIMRRNSIEINIKCKNASDVVKVSFDGTTFNPGYGAPVNDRHTVFATVEKITSSSNTHKVTVWTDDDLYNYNDSLTGSKPYYTNKNIPIIIRYASSASPIDLTVNLTVGPVIDFEFYGPTYVSQNPSTTSGTFTTKVLEYIKNGSNDNGILQTVYPTYPAYDPSAGTDREETVYVPDQANWITKYDFKWCKWSGVGSTDTFTTYFQNPNNGTSTGEYTLRSKDTFPGGEELIPTGTVDAFVEYTYRPLNSDAWYPNANSHKKTSIVKNFMTISNVSWWNGLGEETTTLSNAFLSPIKRGSGETVASLSLQFMSEHGLNLSGAYITTSGPITIDTKVAAEVVLGVSIKLKEDLGRYNDGLSTRIFYTGMKVPFYVTIPKITSGSFTDTFYMTLGPVIAIHHEVASGSFADGTTFNDNLKPETGHKIVLQSRAHEWYKNDSGVVVDTGNDAVGASAQNDRIRRGRQYTITWKYNNVELNETLPTSSCPNIDQSELLSGESVYQYTREFRDSGHHLRVQHAASWTNINRYWKDGGSWRVYVENGTGLADGTLTAQVTVNDTISNPPEISLKHWYDGGKTTLLPVSNEISIVKWTVYNMGSYPPVLENSDLLYTMTTGGRDALVLYLRVKDTSASVNVTSKLQSNGFIAIRQIEVVSGEAWNKVIYMVNTSTFFAHNSSLTNASQRVVSNEQITFTISYTSSTVTTSITHKMHVGPVADDIEILNHSKEFLPDYQGTEIKYQIRVPEWKNTSNYQYYTIGNQTFNVDVKETLNGLWTDTEDYSIHQYFNSSGPDSSGIYTKTRNSTDMPESMRLNVSARFHIDSVLYPYSSKSKSFDVEVVGYLNFYTNESGLNNTRWFLCTSSMMFTYQNVSQYYTFDLEFINNYHYASFLVLYNGSDAYIRRIRSDGSFDQGYISIIAGYIRPEYAYHGDEPSGFAFSWSNEFADCSGTEWATGTSTVITKYEVTKHVHVPGEQVEVNQYQTHFSQIVGTTSRSSVSWCLDGGEQHLPSSSALDKYPFFDSRHPIWN